MNRPVIVAMVLALGLTFTVGCGKPLPKQKVEAACLAQVGIPFWKSWEAKVTKTPEWKALSDAERKEYRAKAAVGLKKDLEKPEGKKVMENCLKAYSKLRNEAQLDCVVKATTSGGGKAAVKKCLEL